MGDGLKSILEKAKEFLANDLDFLSLGDGLAPAIYIIVICIVAILACFLIALIVSAKGKASKLKLSLDDATAFVNATGVIDEENVGGVYDRIKVMPESINVGWGQFMDQQTGNPSDYLTARDVLGNRKDSSIYTPGSKFFRVISSIIILFGILVAAISCVEPLYNVTINAEGALELAKFVLPVFGTMALPWIFYLILNAILAGTNKGRFNKLQSSFSSFQDALDSNVIIFKEVQDEFITENIEEINAAIEDILASKLSDSEILEIVTTPKIDASYGVEEEMLESIEEPEAEATTKEVVKEEFPAFDAQAAAKTEEINRGKRLVRLITLADKATKDPNITGEEMLELMRYIDSVKESGIYPDTDEQEVFEDCMVMLTDSFIHRFQKVGA